MGNFVNPFLLFPTGGPADLEAYLLENGTGHYILEAGNVYLLESATTEDYLLQSNGDKILQSNGDSIVLS